AHLTLREAVGAFKVGRYAEAWSTLDRLGRLRALTPVDRYLRGEVAQAMDEPDRALAELAAIPDEHAVAPLARLRAGQIEGQRGRTRPAEAWFKAALRLLPKAEKPPRALVYLYNMQ